MAFADVILIAALAISLITDICYRKIMNVVTMPAALAGLVYHCISGGLYGLGISLCGLLAGIVILIIPFIVGGIGAGDVKLLGVVGALKGPVFVLYSGLASAVAGGIFALILLLFRGTLSEVLKNTAWGLATQRTSFLLKGKLIGGSFPYGIAIVAGTVFTLITEWNSWLN